MTGSLSKVFREQITSYIDRVVDGRIAWWVLRLLSGELNRSWVPLESVEKPSGQYSARSSVNDNLFCLFSPIILACVCKLVFKVSLC